MGRASSGKKVARAAGTGGGRTARGRQPWAWYTGLTAVILIGSLLVYTSRSERQDKLSAGSAVAPSAANKDHWHAAYGVYICGVFQPPVTNERDPLGIHTHGDGVIHIHPFGNAASGRNAVLGKFADAAQFTLKSGEIKLPGGKRYKDGDKCEGKPGVLQVRRDGKLVPGDPRKVRFLKDRSLITIAFVPKGTKIPDPPSASELDQLTDVPQSQQPQVSIPVTPEGVPEAPPTGEPGEPSGSTGSTTATSTATTAKPK
jgi:hypothetical protein